MTSSAPESQCVSLASYQSFCLNTWALWCVPVHRSTDLKAPDLIWCVPCRYNSQEHRYLFCIYEILRPSKVIVKKKRKKEKECSSETCYNVDEPWKYYAKLKKPDQNVKCIVWMHLYAMSQIVKGIEREKQTNKQTKKTLVISAVGWSGNDC